LPHFPGLLQQFYLLFLDGNPFILFFEVDEASVLPAMGRGLVSISNRLPHFCWDFGCNYLGKRHRVPKFFTVFEWELAFGRRVAQNIKKGTSR